MGDSLLKAAVRLESGPYDTSGDDTGKSGHSAGLQGVDTLLFVNQGLP